MKIYYKHFGFVAIITFLIYLTGCTRDSPPATPSIVGTWNFTTERDIYMTNGATTQDTTYGIPTGESSLVLTAGGQLTNFESGAVNVTGTYTLAGNIFTTITPAGQQFQVVVRDSVITLTAHSLVLQQTDTLATGPLSIGLHTYTYSR